MNTRTDSPENVNPETATDAAGPPVPDRPGGQSGLALNQNRTDRNEEARNSLPAHLRDHYDELVEDYRFATIEEFGGRGIVAYKVIAKLVRAGWRLSEPADMRKADYGDPNAPPDHIDMHLTTAEMRGEK